MRYSHSLNRYGREVYGARNFKLICIVLCVTVVTSIIFYYIMELFSLEEDDAKELFITQTPSVEKSGINLAGLIGDGTDFVSPCVSLVDCKEDKVAAYSDISDDEIFDIPCSQSKVVVPDDSNR